MPLNPTGPDLEGEFLSFHSNNPAVYTLLVQLAFEAKNAGKNKVGIKMLWEVMRWKMYLATTGTDFKLNNNYTSRYARLIMTSVPALYGMFNTRELHTS